MSQTTSLHIQEGTETKVFVSMVGQDNRVVLVINSGNGWNFYDISVYMPMEVARELQLKLAEIIHERS